MDSRYLSWYSSSDVIISIADDDDDDDDVVASTGMGAITLGISGVTVPPVPAPVPWVGGVLIPVETFGNKGRRAEQRTEKTKDDNDNDQPRSNNKEDGDCG